MKHSMMSQSVKGRGKREECINCGVTKHRGFWWLGEYKSAVEPPCKTYYMDVEWEEKAIKLGMVLDNG